MAFLQLSLVDEETKEQISDAEVLLYLEEEN